MWIVILLIFLTIYLWLKYHFSFFKRHGFPFVEPIIPFGSATELGIKEHICEFGKREYDNFKHKGPAFGAYIFTCKIIFITDPALVKEILISNFESFHERGLDVNHDNDLLSKNLFFLRGQEWVVMRKKLTTMFTSGKLKAIFPTISSNSNRLVDFLTSSTEKQEEIEILKVLNNFTAENIVSIVFGLETKCFGTSDNEFLHFKKEFFVPKGIAKVKYFLLYGLPRIADVLKLSFSSKEANNFFFDVVAKNLEYREKNDIQIDDFFQLFLNKKKKNELTISDIVANCYILLLAGLESSSTTMTFCLYELALNPEIQERLRNEINEILTQNNGKETYDIIMEMKYLDMVLQETLRKYPIVDSHPRKCMKDFKIPNSNLTIPAGMRVMIPAFAIHYDDRFFENPEKFDPERFTEENVKKIRPYTYIPFSKGPHSCIGFRLGLLQTKVGLVNVLKNFKIYPCSKTLIPMKFCPSAHMQNPLGGMWLNVKKINQNEK